MKQILTRMQVLWMKVLVETSALVSGSIFCECKVGTETYCVRHRHYAHCAPLFDILRSLSKFEIGIITKTVENEAKNALDRAVGETIKGIRFPTLDIKYRIMALQHVITNECLDKLERIVEESSTRLPIDVSERERIVKEELEPFFEEIVKSTVRYIQPSIPKFIRGPLRAELREAMVEALPSKGTIYKGMPDPRDFVIMAEATMIYRRCGGKEEVYVASKDNHFKPNPIQIGSYLSSKVKYLNEVDPTIRDKAAKQFGFIGEDPPKIIEILGQRHKDSF